MDIAGFTPRRVLPALDRVDLEAPKAGPLGKEKGTWLRGQILSHEQLTLNISGCYTI